MHWLREDPGITAIMETRNRKQTGWHTDPYGLHQDRWLSDGNPTRLIRDGRNEDYDEPPAMTPLFEPVPVHRGQPRAEGEDLIRADDAQREAPFADEQATRAASDVVSGLGGAD